MLTHNPWETWSVDESAAYTLRFAQHSYFTEAQGGLVSSLIPLEDGWSVLDANCGPGMWSLDLLTHYPGCQVTACDSSETMLEEARRLASVRGLASARYLKADLQQIPALLRNRTFDLIYLRNAARQIRAEQWPTTVNALAQLLRPGGWINLVSYEPGPTSSKALNRLQQYVVQMMRQHQKTISSSSQYVGNAASLYRFLLQTSLKDVDYTIHAVDLGFGNSQHGRTFAEALIAVYASMKPQLQEMHLVSGRAYNSLLSQAKEELLQPDACGYGTLFSAVGRKE